MNEPILIGTYGWEHADWEGSFYPPELPPEWRFCFYSNRIRSAIAPGDLWPSIRRADVGQWVDDSDPAFRFVLELPAAVLAADAATTAVEEFFALIEPIENLTAALLLPVPATMPADRLDPLLAALVARFPVCALPSAGASTEALRKAASAYGASTCWRVDRSPAPEAGGDFLVALMEQGDPRRLRTALEQLAAWPGRAAGLFFTGTNAAVYAQEARLLAEIMQL